MAPDKQVEYLHQQASALYLQGEYDAALEAWRALLNLDPADERAREGARLCELLVGQAGGEVKPTPPRRVAAPPPASGVGFAVGEQLDQELSELDELLGGSPSSASKGPANPAPERPRPPSSDDTLEFDLSEVPGASAEPPSPEFHFDVEPQDQPASRPSAEADAFDLGPSEAADPSEASTAAAEELQRRTSELMAEALDQYERGDREAALGALSRLTILDENNEAALNFAAHIRSELEPAPPAEPEVDVTDEPTVRFSPSRGAGTNHEPLDLGAPSPSPPLAQPSLADEPGDGLDDLGTSEEVPDEEGLADELSVARARKGATRIPVARAGRQLPNRWLMIAAGGLVVLGAAYVVVSNMGGSSAEPDEPTQAPVASRPAPPSLPLSASQPPREATTPPAEPVAVPLSPETRAKIDELLDRGDASFEGGDFAAAVLSYNEALKLDPQNEVARKKLQEAGDLFHQEKAKLEERAAAIKSFNEGDYRNALRLFYRIEPANADEAMKLNRYKAIGWYNLGVRALAAGDCRLARSHLMESQQIDPVDPLVRRAMELNASCFEGASQAYFEAVNALPLRGLD